MSYFTGDNQNANTNVQNSNNQDDFIAQIVASKGDQWKDPNVIAKGYVSAQEHIKNLENQVKMFTDAQDKQDYAKDLLEQLRSRQPSVGDATQNNNTAVQEDTTPKFSADELKNLVKSTLLEETENSKKQANISKVDARLTELFGPKAAEVMEDRSKKLGLSKEELQSLAAKSPDAFFALVTPEQRKETNSGYTQGAVNTSASSFNAPSTKNFAYYNKLRREDPKLYRSQGIQAEMYAQRMQLGDAFYN